MSAEKGSPNPQEHWLIDGPLGSNLELTPFSPLIFEEVVSNGLRRWRHPGIILSEADDAPLEPSSNVTDSIEGHREWLSKKLQEGQS